MKKRKSKPVRRSKKSAKGLRLFSFFFMVVLVVILVFLFFSPARKILNSTRLYRDLKGVERALIDDDEKEYRNAKENNRILNLNVGKETGSEEKENVKDPAKSENVQYNKKDRDYLDNLIKNNS